MFATFFGKILQTTSVCSKAAQSEITPLQFVRSRKLPLPAVIEGTT